MGRWTKCQHWFWKHLRRILIPCSTLLLGSQRKYLISKDMKLILDGNKDFVRDYGSFKFNWSATQENQSLQKRGSKNGSGYMGYIATQILMVWFFILFLCNLAVTRRAYYDISLTWFFLIFRFFARVKSAFVLFKVPIK